MKTPSVPRIGRSPLTKPRTRRILGVPRFTEPLAMYDSRLVTTSGINVTAWPDASGVRADATPLVGTPTVDTVGGVTCVDLVGGETLDAGAPGALPASTSWTMYVSVYLPTLIGGDAQYVFGQYYASATARMFCGYSGGAGDVVLGRAADFLAHGGGVVTAGEWQLWTFARETGSGILVAVEESETYRASDILDLDASLGNQIGGLSTTGGTYNSSSAFTLRGYVAHISAWSGYHTAGQRAAMRAAIRAGHGL